MENLLTLINFSDYTVFQLFIGAVGGLLWIGVYVEIIRKAVREKYIEIPYFMTCAKIAWELLYAVLFFSSINLGFIYTLGYKIWFFLDFFILLLILRFGYKQVESSILKKYFIPINVVLISFFIIFLYGWIDMGFDNTPIHGNGFVKLGATSFYLINFGLSVSYIVLFLSSFQKFTFSKRIAWFKTIGTLLFTVLFWQIDTQNDLVKTLGTMIFLIDLVYIYLLLTMQPSKRAIQLKNIIWRKNDEFEKRWLINKETIFIDGHFLRILKQNHWKYFSSTTDYNCEISIIEGCVLFERAQGKITLNDAIQGFVNFENVIEEMNLNEDIFYCISDTKNIKGSVTAGLKKYTVDFYEKFSSNMRCALIPNELTKVLVKLMLPVSKEMVTKWVIANNLDDALKSLVSKNSIERNQLINYIKENQHIGSRITQVNDALSKIIHRELNQQVSYSAIEKDDPFYELFIALDILRLDYLENIEELNLILTNNKKKLDEIDLHFRNLFEHSSEVTFVTDQTDKIIEFNDNFLQFSKLQNKPTIKVGVNINEYYTLAEKALYLQLKSSAISNKVSEIELPIVLQGNEIWISIRYYKVEFDNKKSYFVFLQNDITQKKQLDLEKESLTKQVKERNETLTSFSNILSHKLRHQYAVLYTAMNSDEFVDKMTHYEDVIRILNEMKDVMSDLDAVLYSEIIIPNHLPSTSIKKNKIEHIVLVDDDKIINLACKMILSKISQHVKISVFSNPQIALEQIIAGDLKPDLLLLDINMPELTGWEFLDSICNKNNSFNVIMVSSSNNPEDIMKSYNYNGLVIDYMIKPMKRVELEEKFLIHKLELI